MEPVLFQNNKIAIFPGDEVIFGITTSKMGNGNDSRDLPLIINYLLSFFRSEAYRRLIPNGGQVRSESVYPGHAFESGPISADGLIFIENGKILALCHLGHPQILDFDLLGGLINKLLTVSHYDVDGLKALIYPGICGDCYEVDEKFVNKARSLNIAAEKKYAINSGARGLEVAFTDEYFSDYDGLFRPKAEKPGHYLLSLADWIKKVLLHRGFDGSRIQTVSLCPRHTTWRELAPNGHNNGHPFFSYRRDGTSRRNLVFTKWPESKYLLIASTGDCPYILIY